MQALSSHRLGLIPFSALWAPAHRASAAYFAALSSDHECDRKASHSPSARLLVRSESGGCPVALPLFEAKSSSYSTSKEIARNRSSASARSLVASRDPTSSATAAASCSRLAPLPPSEPSHRCTRARLAGIRRTASRRNSKPKRKRPSSSRTKMPLSYVDHAGTSMHGIAIPKKNSRMLNHRRRSDARGVIARCSAHVPPPAVVQHPHTSVGASAKVATTVGRRHATKPTN